MDDEEAGSQDQDSDLHQADLIGILHHVVIHIARLDLQILVVSASILDALFFLVDRFVKSTSTIGIPLKLRKLPFILDSLFGSLVVVEGTVKHILVAVFVEVIVIVFLLVVDVPLAVLDPIPILIFHLLKMLYPILNLETAFLYRCKRPFTEV